MKLTDHFSLSEFTHSSTATRLGIDNKVPESLIGNLKNLCQQVLEPLRSFANKPIVISSGYRCPMLNRAVGGATNSQHMKGEAVDIRLPSTEEGKQWFTWIMDNCPFDQLIWERSKGGTYWIHVSCKAQGNRQQVIRNYVKK